MFFRVPFSSDSGFFTTQVLEFRLDKGLAVAHGSHVDVMHSLRGPEGDPVRPDADNLGWGRRRGYVFQTVLRWPMGICLEAISEHTRGQDERLVDTQVLKSIYISACVDADWPFDRNLIGRKKEKKEIPLQDVNTNNKKLAHIGIFPFCDLSVAVFRV
ncbi:hypothetical protein OOU_Y34scaffold00910g4 [Pyricularia oryzae Y34]|uniref:Uncharacterized protein n=1 Tax=Pyricularia oryzae (strain Y34) TaxID=1143189 RepID=A0AA97PGG8_PYRO3|nr:hypothetical protein OOU_Y34scaffold00910g4 [Pyricularia oryzae Y34]